MTLLVTHDSEISAGENTILSHVDDINIEAEFGQYIWEEIVTSTNVDALSDLLVLISIRLRLLSYR